MDLTPRKKYPSGSCCAVEFPPPDDGKPSRLIWIDGKRLETAQAIIPRYQAGELTEAKADHAIFELRWG
jgi:hypothetical protein